MGNATATAGINVRTGINVRPLTDRDAADLFQPVVLKIDTGRLAQAAHRSKDAAKRWKQGRQCPSGASLINMARTIPAVQQWLVEESGYSNRDAQAMSADAVIRWAREYRKASGMDGDVARAVLAAVAGIEVEPVVTETIVRDSWKLQDKREAQAVAVEREKSGTRRRS